MSGRRIRLIVWKEVLQLRRDPMLLRILLVMPILQLVFFGYVVAVDVTNLPTAIVDLDRTPTSRSIAADVEGSGYFDVRARPAGEAELRPLMDTGGIRVAVVVPAGTQARLGRGETAPIGIVVDGSDSQSASVGSGYAAQIVARFNARRMAELAGPAMRDAPGLDARVRVAFNPTMASVNTMIPGLVAVILMISLMVVMSQAVVRERERGTLEQMFVTPIRPGEYVVGKVAPYVLFATIQMVVVAVVGLTWFRVPFHGSPGVVLLGIGLFMLVSIGLGLLVSLVSHTRQQAQQTVMFLMIPTMLLSGFIFPIDSMPKPIVPITYLIPLRYVLEVLRGAAVKNAGIEALATPLLVLAGFAAVVFTGAVLATRRRIAE